MRLAAWLVCLAAGCGASTGTTASGDRPSSIEAARSTVSEECGTCHFTGNTDDLPVLGEQPRLAPGVGVAAVDRVCGGDMPPNAKLSAPQRSGVASALCMLYGGNCSGCPEDGRTLRVRLGPAAIRVVTEATGVAVTDTMPAQQLQKHLPSHARSSTFDQTYLLLYVLLAREGCKTSSDPARCMAELTREEQWTVPVPARKVNGH